MKPVVFDSRICELGEGPLWHPLRKQLFWFDILGKRLLTQGAGGPQEWVFDENVSAAGWVDRDRLLIASETGLDLFDLVTGARERLMALEADNPVTRSNDGRADPWGGFWIGTMGKQMEPGAGAIYRYYRGQLRRLFAGLTVPNAICFAPATDSDRSFACFCDTPTRKIMRQALDDQGWPIGSPEVFVDLTHARVFPDGAVFDTAGCLWNAQWGANRCARYDSAGRFLGAIGFAAVQTSCPAFGGDDLATLYMTSAATGLAGAEGTGPTEGQTFSVIPDIGAADVSGPPARGQAEHQVIL